MDKYRPWASTIITLLGVLTMIGVGLYRLGECEESIDNLQCETTATYARKDLLTLQLHQMQNALARIEKRLEKIEGNQ